MMNRSRVLILALAIVAVIVLWLNIYQKSGDKNIAAIIMSNKLEPGAVVEGADKILGLSGSDLVYQALDKVYFYSFSEGRLIREVNDVKEGWVIEDGRVVVNLVSGGSMVINDQETKKDARKAIVLGDQLMYQDYADLDSEDFGYIVNIYRDNGSIFLEGAFTNENGDPRIELVRYKGGYIYTTTNPESEYVIWHILDSEFQGEDIIETDYVRGYKLIDNFGLLVDIGNVYYHLDQNNQLIEFDQIDNIDFNNFIDGYYIDESIGQVYDFRSQESRELKLSLQANQDINLIEGLVEYSKGYMYLIDGVIWYTE